MVFYCVVRLGEFTVSTITRFEPSKHVTCRNTTFLRDQNNLPVIKFNLQVTKCTHKGEDVQCMLQTNCITDPEADLQNHFCINPAPSNSHLFAWRHPKSSLQPLSKNQVTAWISAIAKLCGLLELKGHSLRIGGTLFYLLKGVPFDIIKLQSHGPLGRKCRICLDLQSYGLTDYLIRYLLRLFFVPLHLSDWLLQFTKVRLYLFIRLLSFTDKL